MKFKGKIDFNDCEILHLSIENDIDKLQHFSEKNKNKFISIELKSWRDKRTISQNSFFHLACTRLAWLMYQDHDKKYMEFVKAGIKESYGYRMKWKGKFIPMPSSICNQAEEMSAIIEGVFIEAGELGIDMSDFISDWEKIKKERIENESIDTTK